MKTRFIILFAFLSTFAFSQSSGGGFTEFKKVRITTDPVSNPLRGKVLVRDSVTGNIDKILYSDLANAIQSEFLVPFVNVKSFGAIGDGVADDTNAIQSALNAMPEQGAVLFFPSGIYLVPNGGLTSNKQILFIGEGRNEYEFTPTYTVNSKGSTIRTSSPNAVLLTSTSEGTSFQNIAFECTATNPTAGAGIVLEEAGSFTIDKISIKGFYDNLRVFDGTRWSITNTNLYFPAHYGILIENDPVLEGYPDTGDNSISSVNIVVNKPGVTGVKYKSSGGLKVVNTKINPSNTERVDICFDLESTGNTDQLMISNSSFEGFSGRGIKLSAPTGKVFDSVILVGNQIRSHSDAVTCVEIQGNSEAIRNVVFADNLIKKAYGSETDPAIIVDGISQLNMSGNQIIGFINKKRVTNTGYVYDLDAEGMNYFGQLGIANNFVNRGFRGFSNQGISLAADLSGVLIKTNLDFAVNSGVNLIVTGNTISANTPIEANLQLLNVGNGAITYANMLNKGDGINSAKAFYVDGKLNLWISPKYAYSTFNFEIQTNGSKVEVLSSTVSAPPIGRTGEVDFAVSSLDNVIPLSGTEPNKPITGALKFSNTNNVYVYGDDAGIEFGYEDESNSAYFYTKPLIAGFNIIYDSGSGQKNYDFLIQPQNSQILVSSEDSVFKGLVGNTLFPKQNDPNAFAQIGDVELKQDKLTESVFGQVIDDELAIKMTPSANDEIVMLDSFTGDAVTARFSSFKETGWANYTDTVYTSGSPFTINSGTTSTLPNNAGTVINNQLPIGVTSWYNPSMNKFTPSLEGDYYMVTVRFKAITTAPTAGYFDFGIDIGGALGVQFKETKIFAKGAGIEHNFSIVVPCYTGSTFIANGGLMKLTSGNGNMTVYDINFQFDRVHKAK